VQLGRRNPWLRLSLKRCLNGISPDILHAQGNKAAQLASQIKPGSIRLRVGTVHGIKSSHQAFQKLDLAIAVSEGIFSTLDHPRKQRILNGICTTASTALPPEEPALPPSTVNVIAVGRLEPVKAFATLIRAWAQVSKQAGNTHLTIFGDGSMRSELEVLISQLGLDNEVSLAGFRTNLASLYPLADLTVISSEREGFPYALIESLIAGCPVVSTPVSGATDLLPPQALGENHSVKGLACLIDNALANLHELTKAEGPAMAFAREKLTLKNMTDESERLYFDALANQN
jgi:glycosyltransferase involved in cell wall biosynthesis